MSSNRRGFTLVELLVAVVLLAIVGSAVYQLLVRTQRFSRAESERADLQSNIRAGTLVLASELHEVGYDDSTGAGAKSPDIFAAASDSIVFRAIRSSGIVCRLVTDTIVVDTTRNYSAYRLPVAGRDTLMLYAEIDVTTSTDNVWLRRRIAGVKASTCSASFGSRPGIALATKLKVTGATGDSVWLGAPMRTSEVVVYKFYSTGGKNYLGTYSKTLVGGEAIQPILGPLAANGSQFTYLDSTGGTTTTIAKIRGVRVTLFGTTDQTVNGVGGLGAPAQATDSLRTLVSLRNTLR